ncbi:glycosyltransferase [Clostridium aestuarii]|uniref:Glycosyltransferase n=1 Tax=Clostridium aestuarii TaxID=338193 RepID=A0ABT4CVN3_9CLOT|nr:glycosyltransferase [Clostridium aestuarii]MCY6483039.1 glycosyltransferase [Clostridium aestuarii]
MKKVMIFTASTGGGHNQAAASLEEELKLNGYTVVKLDALKETNKTLESLIIDVHKILANNFPEIYGELYKLSNRKKLNFGLTSIITAIIQNKMYELIQENDPDLIIATHPFIVNVVGRLKKKRKINIPFISVVTDYKAHQTYINKNVDAYITGSYYTKLNMMENGVSKDRIFHYGIPIRREFFTHSISKSRNKESDFTILLMSGSWGTRSMEDILEKLVNSKNKLKIIAVCGQDKTLKKRIEEQCVGKFGDKEIVVYGFTENIPQLMDMSDVIITKPGGLTVSESIAKNIPMIIPYMIPGQEEENAEFLVESGVAIKTEEISDITEVVDKLISNPYLLEKMIRNMKEMSKNYSMERIVQLADRLILEKNYQQIERQVLLSLRA